MNSWIVNPIKGPLQLYIGAFSWIQKQVTGTNKRSCGKQ